MQVVLLGICFLFLHFCDAAEPSRNSLDKALTVSFCDLLKNPNKYDGKRVSVYAYYSYFFEVSWIFCWECKDVGRTWLEIDPNSSPEQVERQLQKGPKGHGVISGHFTGVFHAGGGPYGMGQYSSKFVLQDLTEVKTVIRDTKATSISQTTCSCEKISGTKRSASGE